MDGAYQKIYNINYTSQLQNKCVTTGACLRLRYQVERTENKCYAKAVNGYGGGGSSVKVVGKRTCIDIKCKTTMEAKVGVLITALLLKKKRRLIEVLTRNNFLR